jgi:multiple sugar transport system substrate-binding protein
MSQKHKLSRREFLRLSALAAAGAALAACGPGTTPEPEETPEDQPAEQPAPVERQLITLLHFFGKEADVRRAELDKILGDYNLQSTRYAAQATFVPFGNIGEKFQAGIAAGDPPNVVIHTGQDTGALGLENKAMQIDNFFETSDLPAWDEDNWVGYSIAPWQNTGVDGHKYGIPFLPDTRFLFIDVAAFQDAGLDPNEPPTTWEDLWDYADELDEGEPGNWERIAFVPRWGNSFFMNWSFTRSLFMWDTLDDDGYPVLDRSEVRDTIDWFIEWRDRYGKGDLDAFSASYAGTADPFISGVNPMMINGSWMPTRYATQFPDFEVEYALHPAYPGEMGVHSSWGAGHGLFLPVNNQNAEGGWNLIEFMNQKDRLTEWCVNTGTFVGRLDAMESPRLEQEIGPHWPVAVEQLTTTRASDNQYGAWPTLEAHQAMEAVWDGDVDVGEALAERQQIMNQAIDDWRATHPDVDYAPTLGYNPAE